VSGGDDDWKRGVRPLGDRPAPPEPAAPPPRPRGAPPDFEREADGAGRRRDVSRKLVAGLRRGEWEVERELDLHGLEARAARGRVVAELALARERGLRCLRVIHGRGLHSESEPVLRQNLPDWLAEAPAADAVLAWCPDPQARGGATLVLLRRPR